MAPNSDQTIDDPNADANQTSGQAPMAPPCAMVIFGAAGDLTKRLVVPALYNLVTAGRLPKGFQLVGVDLAAKTTDDWRKGLTEMMRLHGRRRIRSGPHRRSRLALAD
jgi:glucose-6-phosphate 1-dehydrogenase